MSDDEIQASVASYDGPQDSRQDEPMSSLQRLLDERGFEYFQACSKTPLKDENHTLHARLHAAMRRLSEAVREHAVIDAIVEISANLVGCEHLAILVSQADASNDPFIRAVGLTQEQTEVLRSNARGIIESVPEGEVYIKSDADKLHPFLSSLGVTAHVPLWQNSKKHGAIVFFDLLPQRTGLDAGDRALLKLLSVYGGPCLFNC